MRWIITILLVSVLALNSSAQPLPSLNNSDNVFVGGIVLGMNATRLKNSYYPGYHRAGLNVGGTVYVRLKDKFWTSAELLYSQKGAIGVRQMESIYTGAYFEKYYAKLNYVELPILMHLFLKRFVHFSIGGSYSVLMSAREDLISYQPTNLYTGSTFFNDRVFDFIIGGGLHVNKNLFLNIRYQKAVTPTRDAYRVPVDVGFGDQFNTMFVFQLSYMIRDNKNLRNDDPNAEL